MSQIKGRAAHYSLEIFTFHIQKKLVCRGLWQAVHFKMCFVAETRTHAMPVTHALHFWLSHTNHESPFWLPNSFDSTCIHQCTCQGVRNSRNTTQPRLILAICLSFSSSYFIQTHRPFCSKSFRSLSSRAACKRPVRLSVALTPQSAFCSNRKWCNGFVVPPQPPGMVLRTESWQRHAAGSEEDRRGDGSPLMPSSTTRPLSFFNFCVACAVICTQLSWWQLLLTPVSLHLPTVLPRMPDAFI